MTQHAASSLQIAGRHLRPGPQRRRSVRRQVFMGALLCILVGIIWGYWTITDPVRVRDMAQGYLSQIVGGRVTIGKASLSIFEGLRLEGVEVYVDDEGLPDSRIFTARTFVVRASPRALLTGAIDAAQILAVAPQVHLCEDMETGEWNYRRLNRQRGERRDGTGGEAKPVILPEILLRGGLIVYSRRTGAEHQVVGNLAIDGNLAPVGQIGIDGQRLNRYTFDLSSRALMQPHGPRIYGQLDLDRLAVSAELVNLEFDQTIRAMLPAQVQKWWDQHQLAGRVRIPQFSFTPGKQGHDFHIAIEFDDVKLTLRPEDLGGPRSWPKPAAVAWLAQQPLRLRSAAGRIVFTPGQVRINGITGKLDDNTIHISGAIDGYRLDEAPFSLYVTAQDLNIPRLPRYLPILPGDVMEEYRKFLPMGRAGIAIELSRRPRPMLRQRGPGRLEACAFVNIIDGWFCFEDVLYPLRNATGKLLFDTRTERMEIRNVVGYGVPGSVNEKTAVTVSGVVQPMNRNSELEIRVDVRDVRLDPDVRRALPEEARDAIAMFDPPKGTLQMRGDIGATVRLVRRPARKLTVDVDLKIADAQGAYENFRYPIRHAAGLIRIHSNHLEIDNVVARNGDASVALNGTLRWGTGLPVVPDINVTARNVPIDQDLRDALPEEQGKWLETAGLRGTIDVDGRIFLSHTADRGEDVDIGLNIALRDGSIWPMNGAPAVSSILADLDISLSRLVLRSASGKRGDAPVTGSGYVAWSGPRPEFGLRLNAEGVAADKILYEMCPPEARQWWDRLRPDGRADLAVVYSGSGPMIEAVAGKEPTADAPAYAVTIRPRGMSIRPASFSWLMEGMTGEVQVTPTQVALKDLTARHGDATVRFSGKSNPDDTWTLALSADKVAIDESLLSALPDGLRGFVKSIELGGTLSLDCPTITMSAESLAESANPVNRVEIEGRIALADGSMDLGASLAAIDASSNVHLTLLGGELHALRADIHADSLLLAGRPMRSLQCRVIRPAGRNIYQFRDLRGRIAGGNLAGQIDLAVPKTGSSRYGVSAVLKDVDLSELLGGDERKVRGLLTGNLTLEGTWDSAADRRGRGDVQVRGKELYHVPVVFGLIQVANLAMPIKSPFQEATARYVVEGDKLLLERMELRAANMLMEGSGSVDFRSKAVGMIFTTHNPQWPKLPIVGPLLDSARKELLQIHVTGKVEAPDVEAKSMRTFTTTIDEVLSGDAKKPQKKPQK